MSNHLALSLLLGALGTACLAATVAKEHGVTRNVATRIATLGDDSWWEWTSSDAPASNLSFDARRAHAMGTETPYFESPAQEASARAERLGLGAASAASAVLRGELADAWITEAGGDVGSGTFAWPVVDGWRVRGFGSGEGGYHKAIDIGGEIGGPVHAADEGIVVYAGEEIPGYGKIVVIVHKGNFATFYAHLSELSVAAGQRVSRADAIGKVGSTGISRGPHVHFELIHDRGNCDPEPLFRPGVRGVDGEHLYIEQAQWDGRGTPPAQVRCEPRPSGHPDSE